MPIQKDTKKVFRKFRICVFPSLETNDHEVRFYADEDDIIALFWKDMIGLDPDDILVEPCKLRGTDKPRRTAVARCSCGVIGCGSVSVEITRSVETIKWEWGCSDSTNALRFTSSSYDAEVERALRDTTWETPDRTAARLLSEMVDREILARYDLTYSWASGRLRKGTFSVSLNLEPSPFQLLLHFPWNAEPSEQIAKKCAEILAEPPNTWTQVEWFPQRADLGAPDLAGPTWRRG